MNDIKACTQDVKSSTGGAQTIELRLPAHPRYARCVRMLAANIAVVCDMSVDDVEDLRMAAEEAFVYSCSTSADVCCISVKLTDHAVHMDVSLGNEEFCSSYGEDESLVEMMLGAVCDSFSISNNVLHLEKTIGVPHVS